MKKSTLLSLATAGAIVTTSAFTFAAWDQTSDITTGTFTLRSPLVLEMGTMTVSQNETVGELPTYTATTSLTLENMPESITAETHEIKYTAKVYKNYVSETNKGVEVTEGLTITPIGEENPKAQAHNVSVEVTPTDTTEGKALADDTNYTVEVTAELVSKQGN